MQRSPSGNSEVTNFGEETENQLEVNQLKIDMEGLHEHIEKLQFHEYQGKNLNEDKLVGQSDELPSCDDTELNNDSVLEKILENNGNLLPVSTQDLANTLRGKALSWKVFLGFLCWSVINIPPEHHGTLLLLCGSFLGYQVKNLSTPFDFQNGISSNAPLSQLSFGEAFSRFLPEMAHITKFMLCYFVTLMLVWPLQLGVQIFIMLLLISAPLYYFPELARKASGIDVACGSFKVPVIWFASLGALGLSLICGLLTLLMVYFSWRHIYERRPRMNELKVSLNDLSEILGG